MQTKSNKLIFAWCVFVTILVAFILVTKLFFDAKKDQKVIYLCRILIDSSLRQSESTAAATGAGSNQRVTEQNTKSPKKIPVEDNLSDDAFYEHTAYGLLPKISQHGIRVLDAFAAKFDGADHKKICAAVLLDNISVDSFAEKIKLLCEAKITFIIPHYFANIARFVDCIRNNGHEFFIQIPTQTSIPNNKKSEISPFLANTAPEALLDKLLYLLASTKYAIGVSNTTSTLLTKSANDMSVINDELSKRGLAFLNIEKSDQITQRLSENPEFLCANSAVAFSARTQISESELADGKIFFLHINELDDFLSKFSKQKNYILAPISCLMKRK